MKKSVLFLCFVFCLPAALRADDEPRLSVSLSRTEIYEGQSVEYRVVVDNVENPPTPELRGMEDCDSAFLGQRSLDSHQVTIINGVMSQVDHRGREFHYRLTPRKAGEFVIPGPELTVGGKPLRGEKLRLIVQPPSAQDIAIVELSSDRPAVYPTQPFTVTLSVFVKELPGSQTNRDPLSVQKPRPRLNIPWLTDQALPAGLSPQEDWQQWVKGYIDSDGVGFGLNDLVQRTAFSFFDEGNSIAFRPHPRGGSPRSVVRRNAKGREVSYRRYDFTRTFTAKQVGPITFSAVTLQGTFANEVGDDGELRGKEIYAASKSLTIRVKDVPHDGRPDSYIGAIGRFRLEAELTPRKSKVGDPLTFTLVLSGSGSLSAVKPPDLSKLPDVAARFKVYDATQKTEADSAKFVYALRPLTASEEPFPAVAASYFDVDEGRYATLKSDPIPINVTKAEQLSSDQIVAAPRVAGQTSKDLEVRREGVFANITDVGAVRDQGIRPAAWLAGLGGCIATYVLVAVGAAVVRRRTQDKSALRRRAAAARARQQLREAVARSQVRQVSEAADRVQDALAGLVADVAGVQDAALTGREVLRQLQDWKLDPSLIARAGRLLDACDATRYGGAAAIGDLCEEGRQVLEAVIAALRGQRRLR
jgi:hypothetical protein